MIDAVANSRFLVMPNGLGERGFCKTISFVKLLMEYGFRLREAYDLTNELVARGRLPIGRYPDVPEALLASLRALGLDVEHAVDAGSFTTS